MGMFSVARSSNDCPPRRTRMSDIMLSLAEIDRVCGRIALALHNSELQIYATLALIVALSFFLFPSKDDPDQV